MNLRARARLRDGLFTALLLSIAACEATTVGGAPPGAERATDRDDSAAPLPPPGANKELPPKEEGPVATTPKATAVKPSAAALGSPPPTVVVTGAGFTARSFVEADLVPIPSTFVSPTELRATLPERVLAQAGVRRITVTTPAPGGGTSAPVSFAVENPSPTVAALTPASALLNGASLALTITGSGFVAGTRVTYRGDELATTFVDDTRLDVEIPAARLTTSGTFPVAVVSPAPGGGESKPLSFTVANPNVAIATVAPVSALVGASQVTLAITGSGFVPASQVSFNGSAIASTFQDAGHLTAIVPASALVATGNFPLVATNPAPGGGVSIPVLFQVASPEPKITTLAPGRATAGDAPTTVVVSGANFTRDTRITFDAVVQATTFVSATELRATLPAARLALAGTVAVRASTPAPGGGTSPAATFTIENPAPTTTSITPASLVAGAGDTTLVVFGTKLLPTSVVSIDGAPLVTSFVSATQLKAALPAARSAAATTLRLVVTNPAPGGGASAPRDLVVAAPLPGGSTCDTTGVTVALDALASTKSVPLDYAFPAARRFRYSLSDPRFSTCPVPELSAQSAQYSGIVVQNTSAETAYVNVWASCVAASDALLAVYASAATVPSTDAARMACTGRVANGTSSPGAFSSPEANGSTGCPGLTKANGGAIALAPCAKAALVVQPFDYAGTVRPTTLKVQLEK